MDIINEPLISVIVPAYNAEKTVAKCIKSIQKNTYKNLEIIVVNDGSKDKTREAVEALCEDRRIILINKKNGGVSRARNTGIDIAKGEYIAFIDSDDYISEDYFEKLITPCIENNADVSCCVYQMVDPKGNKIKHNRKKITDEFFITPQQIADNYFECLDMGFVNFVFRIYKKSAVENIRFSETLKWGEDGSFNLELFKKSNKIFVSPKEMYFYVVHPNQATSKKMKGYTYMMIQHIGDIDNYIKSYDGYRLQKIKQGMGRTCLGVIIECAAHSDSMKNYKKEFFDFRNQPWCEYITDSGELALKWKLIHKLVLNNCYRLVYLITKIHRFILGIKYKIKAILRGI